MFAAVAVAGAVAVVVVVAASADVAADQLEGEQTINRGMMNNKQQQPLTTAIVIPC